MVYNGMVWLGILLATIAVYILGALWYSPILFGKIWMKLMKFDKKSMKGKNMTLAYIGNFISTFITLFILAYFLMATENMINALLTTILIWIGFQLASATGSVFWEGKPWGVYWINMLYSLSSLVIATLIIVQFL
ncbi:DUF1761 domain-containing protein [Candidatus Woesearchaeota archaeon]|nr:DUF1761 domain-containing protein [Candidatus Woesearchaeota archaeon]